MGFVSGAMLSSVVRMCSLHDNTITEMQKKVQNVPPLLLLNTYPQQCNTSLETMELCVQGYDDDTKYVIEVGENDTTETMRQKVASATGLGEDSFRMGFGGKEEGEDITELSAGDTVVLTKTTKYASVEALRALGETDISEARLATGVLPSTSTR